MLLAVRVLTNSLNNSIPDIGLWVVAIVAKQFPAQIRNRNQLCEQPAEGVQSGSLAIRLPLSVAVTQAIWEAGKIVNPTRSLRVRTWLPTTARSTIT